MTTNIKIPIQQLTPQLIQEWQEKYPNGEIEVRTHSETMPERMTEDTFWEIMELLDWSKEEENAEAVIAPAVARLAALPVFAIYNFQDILSEKLYVLDARRYAAHIGEAAFREDEYFSVDHFLHARCYMVAIGKEAYEQAVQHPALMLKDLTFEALLSVASKAYELKTGTPLTYLPAFDYETYSNKEGWQ